MPPISLVEKVSVKKLQELGISFYKVPCCSKCNSKLGARRLVTVEERLLFLYDKYTVELLKSPIWSREEINELSGNLKKMVQGKQAIIQRELVERLEYIKNVMLANKFCGV